VRRGHLPSSVGGGGVGEHAEGRGGEVERKVFPLNLIEKRLTARDWIPPGQLAPGHRLNLP